MKLLAIQRAVPFTQTLQQRGIDGDRSWTAAEYLAVFGRLALFHEGVVRSVRMPDGIHEVGLHDSAVVRIGGGIAGHLRRRHQNFPLAVAGDREVVVVERHRVRTLVVQLRLADVQAVEHLVEHEVDAGHFAPVSGFVLLPDRFAAFGEVLPADFVGAR